MATLLGNKFAVPIGLLLAFVCAVGVWFVPINPERRAASGSGGGASWMQRIGGSAAGGGATTAGDPNAATWAPPRGTKLSELPSRLDALREPPPAPVVVEEGPDLPVDEEDVAPAPPPVITLDWEYQGSVVAGDTRAAMMRIGDRQRFVFEGDFVPDPENPTDSPIEILAITPTMVVASKKGVEIRIPLVTLSEAHRELVLSESGGESDALLVLPPPELIPPAAATPEELELHRQASSRQVPGMRGRPDPNAKDDGARRTPTRRVARPASPSPDRSSRER
ncbi:MAG: hypothetical protein ACTS3F_01445 [Phycisphaerales bacterium]